MPASPSAAQEPSTYFLGYIGDYRVPFFKEVSRGYIGIMEKKMETTIVNLGVILGLWKRKWAPLYWGT